MIYVNAYIIYSLVNLKGVHFDHYFFNCMVMDSVYGKLFICNYSCCHSPSVEHTDIYTYLRMCEHNKSCENCRYLSESRSCKQHKTKQTFLGLGSWMSTHRYVKRNTLTLSLMFLLVRDLWLMNLWPGHILYLLYFYRCTSGQCRTFASASHW